MNVFDLVAKITLDQSEYNESLDDAGKSLEGFGGKLKKGLGTAAKVGGAALATVGAAGVALTKTVLDGAASTAAYGDNIDKMSQKMGISAQAYQEWDAILQHSGSSIDGMQRGMMTLSNAAVKGSGAFKKLGLSEKDVASMNQEELFAAVITGLQGMDEGAERAALAQELLGGAAKELGPLLNTTAEDTEAMRQRVHELGGVMSNEAVKAAAAYQDSLQDMQTAFTGLKNGLVTEFMPSITKVMDGLTEIFTGNGEGGIQMISEGIDELVTNISDKLPEFIDLGMEILDSLIDAIIKNLPKLLQTAGELIGKLIAGIIQYLPQLIKQAPEIVKAIIKGIVSAWPSIRSAGSDLVDVLWNGIKGAWGRLTDYVKGLWEDLKSIFSGGLNIGVNANNNLMVGQGMPSYVNGYASGLEYVPYDNFPAYLHHGEAVLTASEADEWRSGGGVTINVYPSQGMNEEQLAKRVERVFVDRARQRRLLNA